APLRFDLVTRRAAALSRGLAVQIVDHRQTGADRDFVGQRDRIGERELEAPPAAAATAAAEAATASASTSTAATAFWRRRRRCAGSLGGWARRSGVGVG